MHYCCPMRNMNVLHIIKNIIIIITNKKHLKLITKISHPRKKIIIMHSNLSTIELRIILAKMNTKCNLNHDIVSREETASTFTFLLTCVSFSTGSPDETKA